MTITFNIFRSLLEWLGLLESEIQRIDRMIKEYSQKLAIQQHHLKDIKYDIEDYQVLILLKENDLHKTGQTEDYIQVVKAEIAILFKKIEHKSNLRDLIVRNIEALTLVINQLNQLKLAIETKLDTDALQDLRDTLSDYLVDLDEQDKELEKLEKVSYKAKNDDASKVEESLNQLYSQNNKSNVQPTETQNNPEIVNKPVTPDSAASSESSENEQIAGQEKDSTVKPTETQTKPEIVNKTVTPVSSASSESDSDMAE